MEKIKTEPTENNANDACVSCSYCQAKTTAEKEQLAIMNCRETEILDLKEQIQNFKGVIKSLQQELDEKDSKL